MFVSIFVAAAVSLTVSLTVCKKYLPGEPEHSFSKFMLTSFMWSLPITFGILYAIGEFPAK